MTAQPVPRFDLLPRVVLAANGPVASAFRARGCTDLQLAAEFVWKLPYGRNLHPEEPLGVLTEARGTCSTKHALLARLLEEGSIRGFELRLGIYQMNEANTPGVGSTLARHGPPSIPEAHCYLAAGAVRLDCTRVLSHDGEPVGEFLAEAVIRPDQIGDYKRAFHRGFLVRFVAEHPEVGRTADELWRIRESCIAALSAGEQC